VAAQLLLTLAAASRIGSAAIDRQQSPEPVGHQCRLIGAKESVELNRVIETVGG
jgi:hypothetical protein